MPRIAEQDRLAIIDAIIAHWQQADALNGAPIEIVPGFGVAQLITLRDQYHDKQEEIAQLLGDLENRRAERGAVWGFSPQDDNGAWHYLTLYKEMVKARLGARNPLTRTVPNIGRATVERYITILHRFIDHWGRVNAALAADLTLGAFTLANLQTAHDDLLSKMQQIDQLEEALLPLAREEREQLFGDEAEELREETSIIARMVLYDATIRAMFPNQPIADSLPEIFPSGTSTPLPTFRFNWMQEPTGDLKTWHENPGIAEATDVFLKEGVVETTQVIDPAAGNIAVHIWSGITVVDDLDLLELRDENGTTVARGTFDANLQEPA